MFRHSAEFKLPSAPRRGLALLFWVLVSWPACVEAQFASELPASQAAVHAAESVTIILPDKSDAPQSVAGLKALGVRLELNEKGNVHSADATESKLTDSGLVHLGNLHQLTILDLSGRPITDRGLQALSGSTVLQELYLNETKITDRGVASLRNLRNLAILALRKTGVSGAGLVHLDTMRQLMVLNLGECDVADDDLRALHKLPVLEVLTLPGTRVTTAGLAHLKPIKKLRVLNVIDCAVDDSGFESLKSLDNLRMLYVRGTKVTPEGIESMGLDVPALAIFD